MSFEFKDGRYVARLFYCEFRKPAAESDGNWMAVVWKDNGEDEWHIQYRFRYYVDDDLTNRSKDEKNWYHAKTTDSLPAVLTVTRAMAEICARGQTIEEVVVDRDQARQCLDVIAAQPWAQVTRVPAE